VYIGQFADGAGGALGENGWGGGSGIGQGHAEGER